MLNTVIIYIFLNKKWNVSENLLMMVSASISFSYKKVFLFLVEEKRGVMNLSIISWGA